MSPKKPKHQPLNRKTRLRITPIERPAQRATKTRPKQPAVSAVWALVDLERALWMPHTTVGAKAKIYALVGYELGTNDAVVRTANCSCEKHIECPVGMAFAFATEVLNEESLTVVRVKP